jgi:carboxypeptidase Q
MKKTLATFLTLTLFVMASFAQQKEDQATVFQKIHDEVAANSKAYETLGNASETIGHRLTSSENGVIGDGMIKFFV